MCARLKALFGVVGQMLPTFSKAQKRLPLHLALCGFCKFQALGRVLSAFFRGEHDDSPLVVAPVKYATVPFLSQRHSLHAHIAVGASSKLAPVASRQNSVSFGGLKFEDMGQ